jgi:hypothetical protein
MQQQFDSFEDHFQDLYRLTESPRRFPFAEDQLMIGDAPMDVPSISTEFETNYPAVTFQAAGVLQQANHRIETNDDNNEFSNLLLHLEAEVRESLPIDVGQDLHVTSATSLASARSNNVRTAQLVSDENIKPSNQLAVTAEENVECTISDRNALKSRKNKAQE